MNLGLPRNLLVRDFVLLLLGARDVAIAHGCKILGGDLSDSSELSISATAVGQVDRSRALSRQTAKVGDLVFISRPLGLTPAAFRYFRLGPILPSPLPEPAIKLLYHQFTGVGPMFSLAAALAASGRCTSCMDNTDGIGQSLLELSENSEVAIVIDQDGLMLPEIVREVAAMSDQDPFRLAFAAGADFSLVGTITPHPVDYFSFGVSIIGRIEQGRGVYMASPSGVSPLIVEGWNYYAR